MASKGERKARQTKGGCGEEMMVGEFWRRTFIFSRAILFEREVGLFLITNV